MSIVELNSLAFHAPFIQLRCVSVARPDLERVLSAHLCALGLTRYAELSRRLGALLLDADDDGGGHESHQASSSATSSRPTGSAGSSRRASASKAAAAAVSLPIVPISAHIQSPIRHSLAALVLRELAPRLLSARGPFKAAPSSSTSNPNDEDASSLSTSVCEEELLIGFALHRIVGSRLGDGDRAAFAECVARAFPAVTLRSVNDATAHWNASAIAAAVSSASASNSAASAAVANAAAASLSKTVTSPTAGAGGNAASRLRTATAVAATTAGALQIISTMVATIDPVVARFQSALPTSAAVEEAAVAALDSFTGMAGRECDQLYIPDRQFIEYRSNAHWISKMWENSVTQPSTIFPSPLIHCFSALLQTVAPLPPQPQRPSSPPSRPSNRCTHRSARCSPP
jgi:hypothetical protein